MQLGDVLEVIQAGNVILVQVEDLEGVHDAFVQAWVEVGNELQTIIWEVELYQVLEAAEQLQFLPHDLVVF